MNDEYVITVMTMRIIKIGELIFRFLANLFTIIIHLGRIGNLFPVFPISMSSVLLLLVKCCTIGSDFSRFSGPSSI